MRRFASMLGLLLACAGFAASAAVAPKEVLGKWVEQGENGAIGWDFAAEQITITPLDASGRTQAESSRLDVLFQPHNGGWVIVLRTADSGAPIGEGAMQLVKDGSLLVMLPGIGEHQLRRADAKPAAKSTK